jgi:hypothetical protein
MFRLLNIFTVLVAGSIMLSCQTYSTGLQQSVARADETSAIMTLKTISTTQQTYAAGNGGAYGSFQQLCEAGYLDSRFNSANPQFKGYTFSINVGDKSFSCNADPAPGTAQSARHFYIDSVSDEMHANPTQPATSADPGLN